MLQELADVDRNDLQVYFLKAKELLDECRQLIPEINEVETDVEDKTDMTHKPYESNVLSCVLASEGKGKDFFYQKIGWKTQNMLHNF